jgi:hypothetical protein
VPPAGQASVCGPDEEEEEGLLDEIVELPPIDEDVLAASDDGVFCWAASFHHCAADETWPYEPNAWMQAGGGGIAAAHVDEMAVVPGTDFAADQLWTSQPDSIMPSGLGAFLWNL